MKGKWGKGKAGEGSQKGSGKEGEGRREGTGQGRGSSFTPDQKYDFWACRLWASGSQCLVLSVSGVINNSII